MKKIKVLKIIFEGEIKPYEIPAFRGAVISKVGQENTLFHNHIKDGYNYKYPLIQYKSIHGHPTIVCIDEGTDEIQKLFSHRDWEDIKLSNRWIDMKIHALNMNQFTMQISNTTFNYRIKDWIALNQYNYIEYQKIQNIVEQSDYLKRKLIGNILSFAKGIGWHISQPIELELLTIPIIQEVVIKDKKVLGFNLEFKTNIYLPSHIGLGKSVSIGYGVVSELKLNK